MKYRTVSGFVLFSLIISIKGAAGEVDARQLANSDQPSFETFPLKFSQKIAGEERFAFPAQPSITRAPDGRLFLTFSTAIGYGRGERIVGTYSSDGGKTWEPPIELINNPDREDANPVIIVDGQRLMVIAAAERLPEKIDKFNPWPARFDRTWWYMTSTDDGGKTWAKPMEVKQPHLLASPRGVNGYRQKDGTLVLPYYYVPGADRGNVPENEAVMVSADAMAHSTDGGLTWTSGQAIDLPESRFGADEPATVLLSNGEIFCLFRNCLDRLYEPGFSI